LSAVEVPDGDAVLLWVAGASVLESDLFAAPAVVSELATVFEAVFLPAVAVTVTSKLAVEFADALVVPLFVPFSGLVFAIAPFFADACFVPAGTVALAPLVAFAVEFALSAAVAVCVAPLAGLALAPPVAPGAKLPVVPAEAFAGAGVGCAAGGGLSGALGVVGAAVLASSRAAKGCELLSWLVVDAGTRGGEENEIVAATSDAILGILGTGRPLETP